MHAIMGFKQKSKEIFYLFTFTLLTLLLPLSFLLLAKFSDAQYYLQTLSPQHFPYLLTLALYINPLILYFLVSAVSIFSLIHGLTGKIIILSNSSSSLSSTVSVFQPRLYVAWILLCTFQVCVGLGIEGSILAGLYDSASDDIDSNNSSFDLERGLLSRVVFVLGLHESMHVWARMVVRPVVDDTVYGVDVRRKEWWVERVAVAASLGSLWWWKLREDVESLVVMVETKKEQFLDVKISDFVGWWLYYITVTIGMIKLVKGLMWIPTIFLCRRTSPTISTLEHSENDDKV